MLIKNFPQEKGVRMNSLDNVCEIIERVQRACLKSEEIGTKILHALEQMEQIERWTEEEKNV